MAMGNIELGFNCPVGPERFQSVEGGNYCDLCQKKVFDLKGMAPTKINELLSDHPKGVCGTVTLDQLANSPEEKLALSTGRLLKAWEVWLLAMVFCFGIPLSSDAQTTSPSDPAEGIASVGERIDQFLVDLEQQACQKNTYVGIIVMKDYGPKFIWDTTKIENRGNRGFEIIVLRPFLYYPENEGAALSDSKWQIGLSRQLEMMATSADSIYDFPWKTIHIHGHADVDEEGDLQELSEMRAEEVAAWLRKWKLPNEIKVKGFGATKPYDGPKGPAQERNRRVEIIMAEDWNY